MSESEMNLFSQVVDNAVENAEKAITVDDADYYKDGLLYCGKCNTKKQTKLKWTDGSYRTVPCVCRCPEIEKAEHIKREEQKRKMELIEKLKADSLIGEKYKDVLLSALTVTPHNNRQIKICNRYVDKFDELYKKNQGLLFFGGCGIGKTLFTCCIGNELIKKMHTVLAISFGKILEMKKNDIEDRIAKANTVDLLILDDLGAERDTPYAREFVYNIIDTRYRAGKPMIITTNLDLKEMQNESDIKLRRVYDRIFEVCYPMKFEGPSWRLKEAALRFDETKQLLEE